MADRFSRAARGALAAALIIVAAVVWSRWPDGPAQPRSAAAGRPVADGHASTAQSADGDRRADLVASLRRAAARPQPAWNPASLRDTAVDGELVVDGDGRLRPSPALRRFFEYFFVASGEAGDSRIRARVAAAIAARTSGEAQRAALDLLDRYLAYRERARRLAARPGLDEDLAARAEAVRAIRRESFGEEIAAALFADEEAALSVALERRRIAADSALDEAEREARIAALDERLPPPMRDAREEITAPLRLARDEQALRDAGGSAEEVQALREQAVGREAADRLAALDRRRADWRERVDAYRRERTAIDGDPRLDAERREEALEALRERHFQGAELARIRALDRVHAATP